MLWMNELKNYNKKRLICYLAAFYVYMSGLVLHSAHVAIAQCFVQWSSFRNRYKYQFLK